MQQMRNTTDSVMPTFSSQIFFPSQPLPDQSSSSFGNESNDNETVIQQVCDIKNSQVLDFEMFNFNNRIKTKGSVKNKAKSKTRIKIWIQ